MWKTALSVWRLARAAAASGTVSSPVPAAGSPSGRVNVTMSEAEGGWADLLHETVLEASSSQASAKPASVPEVAPANAVYCLASEGDQSSDDVSFLWPGGKYGIRRREGSGDVHKEVVCADGRENGAAATFSDGRH